MMLNASKIIGRVIAGILFGWSLAATAMTVQPVVLDLSAAGRGVGQVITVQNTFAQPLPVEIRVEEIIFDDKGMHNTGKDPGDLVIFPAHALIQPGQVQTFRVQYVGDPALSRSKHYYATVAQLPVKLPEGQATIQVLYNFQVLVSVAPSGVRPALKVQKAEIARDEDGKPVPAITLLNGSAAHGYLSGGRLRIVQRDAAGKEIFHRVLTGPEIEQLIGVGLVAPGETRRFVIPFELPAGTGSLEAQFTAIG